MRSAVQIRVVVVYLGQVRINMSVPREEVLVGEHPTIRDLLRVLHAKHGTRFAKAALDQESGGLNPYLIITVNGANACDLQGLDTAIGDGDEVAFVPPLTGG